MNEQTIICLKGVFFFWIAVSLCLGCGGGEGVEGRPKGRCTSLHCREGEEELLEETKVLDTRRRHSSGLQHSLLLQSQFTNLLHHLALMHQLAYCLLLVKVGLLYPRKTIFDISEQM